MECSGSYPPNFGLSKYGQSGLKENTEHSDQGEHASNRQKNNNAGAAIAKRKKKPAPKAAKVLAQVEKCLDDDQADDVQIVPLAGKAEFADYMVIASGASRRKVEAMATHIQTNLKGLGLTDISVEGRGTGDWVLLDAGDIIVHLFRPEIRTYYDLEKLWDLESEGPRRPEPATA